MVLIFKYWLMLGMKMGWVSAPYCNTHEGGLQYWTEEEVKEWEAGGEPCENVIRLLD